MRVLRFSLEAAREAARVVGGGGVIVYPTDTVYGLGCSPTNHEAVERVEEVKGRRGKPMPVLASDLRSLKRICSLHGPALELALRFWPGQLTIVVPAKPGIPASLRGEGGRVGVRIPGSLQALTIIEESGGLLVGTSANLTGRPPPKSIGELSREVAEKVDLVIDGGRCALGEPSTVIEPLADKLLVRRVGAVSLERLRPAAEELGLALEVG